MPFLMVHLYSFAFPNKSICAVWYEAGVCQTTANVWCVVRVCLYAYSVQYTIILIIIIWDFCQFCQCRSCSNQTTAIGGVKSTYTTMNRYTHPAHSRMHDGHSSKHVQPVTVPHTNAFPVFSRRFFCWFPEYWVKIATCFKKVVVPSHDQGRSNEHQHMPSNAPQKRSPVFPWVIRDCFVDALKKKT